MIFWIKFTPFFPHPSYIRAMCVHVQYTIYVHYMYICARYVHTHARCIYILRSNIIIITFVFNIFINF